MNTSLKILYLTSTLCSLFLIFIATGLLSHEPCRTFSDGLKVCAASDMARITKAGEIHFEDKALDLSAGGIRLDAARNETVSFQLLLMRGEVSAPNRVMIHVDDLIAPDQRIKSDQTIRLFMAYYHWVEPGGYDWGPKSKVLPWPDFYPDALIPLNMVCGDQVTPILDSFPVPKDKRENQSIWVDIFIPPNAEPGVYQSSIRIQSGDVNNTIPLKIKIWDATLPDQPSIEAVGELYDSYKLEGVGTNLSDRKWVRMAHCYQQMAHRHRMVFIERLSLEPDQDWKDYNKIYSPILNGHLFSFDQGYTGPGMNQPVSIWRTPWGQVFNARIKAPLSDQQIRDYEHMARSWQENVDQNQWHQTDFFAYIFDEVDGATDEDELGDVEPDYIRMVHAQMDRVQKAIDQGAGNQTIDLIWTSHTDPAVWDGIPGEDLKGIIRLWSPSANVANVDYLTERKKEGGKIWFYHSGHPAIGIHSINASGIEMRTWGVVTAKYHFDGHFMWAINLSDPEKPYHFPSYKRQDDRFGNGTMVYPGYKLDTLGLESVPGPIPSMRLKAWRRGLQDAELILLARKAGHQTEVEQMLDELIPSALSEGKGKASWSSDPQDWIAFKRRLLELTTPR